MFIFSSGAITPLEDYGQIRGEMPYTVVEGSMNGPLAELEPAATNDHPVVDTHALGDQRLESVDIVG